MKLHALINHLPAIVYLYDVAKNRMVYCNDALTRILGYDLEELNEIGWETIIYTDDLESVLKVVAQIASGQKRNTESIRYRVMAIDGQIKCLLSHKNPMYGENPDQPEFILGIATDVTDQYIATEKFLEEVRNGLNKEEFKLYGQPIVELRSGLTVGHELLTRWHHPERGILQPREFIPMIERDPAMTKRFCLYVLSRGCEQLETPSGLFISINLSPVTVEQGGFFEFVQNLLQHYHCDSSRLLLELTETTLIQDIDALAELLVELRGLGVGTVLDDFGTGHNSLRNLMRLRAITKIKIDKEFIDAIETHDGAIIIRTIIAMAHSLEIGTVAEGIETERQCAILRAMGCQLGQGFLFGRPALNE